MEDVQKKLYEQELRQWSGAIIDYKIRFGLNLGSASCLDIDFLQVTPPS